METHFSPDVMAGLQRARMKDAMKKNRLRVHDGETAYPVLKIWETDYLRLRQESEPISKEKADEIFHTLTLDGENLFDHLEMDFNPQAFEHHTGNDYAIKNEEIKRFERLYKEAESEEDREARLAKEKQEAAAMSEAAFNATLWTSNQAVRCYA